MMIIKEFKVFKNTFRFNIAKVVVLTSFILILPGLNSRYALAQEDLKNKIIEDQMQQLKSRIWRWEGRIQKKPNKISSRNEIIQLREKYLELLDDYIKIPEKKLKDNPGNIEIIEKKIQLIEEKNDFYIKLKDDYIKCIDLNIEGLGEIDRILMTNPERIRNISIQLFNTEDVYNYLIQIKEGLSKSTKMPLQKEEESDITTNISNLIASTRSFITMKIAQNIQMKKDYIKKWDDKILELEKKLLIIKNDFIQLLDDRIQQVEAKLKEKPGDITLIKKLKELKYKKVRITESEN